MEAEVQAMIIVSVHVECYVECYVVMIASGYLSTESGSEIIRQLIMFMRQLRAIQAKNWTINARAKQYVRQNISVLILSVFIVISEHTDPNAFQTPFYLGIAITSYSRAIAVHWLSEKETHQKELQRIMGLSYLSYLCSWLLYFILNGLIISTVMLVIMRLLVITDDTVFIDGYGFWDLVPLYFLFVLGNIGFVLFLCCFFSKAKNGSQAVTFIQLITNFLYFFRFSSTLAHNKLLITFFSIFPQMSFNMAVSNIAFINQQFKDMSFDYSYSTAVPTLLISFGVYTLLALYLGEILPNEMGTQKHPLFFLGKKTRANELDQPLLGSNEAIQHDSSAKYEEPVVREHAPLIKVKHLTKIFGQKTVVDDLSVNFYGGQIFCLLGHNGAGKSTTINLLTGLLQPQGGNIDILGLKYPADVDEIRKHIGLCLQYNVLYDDLTVEEHLRFYYRIKNQDNQSIEDNINRTITECALQFEKGKLAKNLSGGNKRKLCLANSLIGGSRIIFLDEPSSGLDPNSRQSIWAILKNISNQNRCIILTTHHLEEAEQLSKRIAIMSKGKLIILGTTHFITHHFSVGYHVVITLPKEEQAKAADLARNIVTKNIMRCTEDKQTAKGTLKFILPLEELPNFSKTFSALEQADIGQISVYVSNLEDAFVKIGEEEENQTEGFEKLINNSESEEIQLRRDQPRSNEVVLPEVSCSYSFSSQFKAVFIRKLKSILRSFSTVISIAMPTAFMSAGVLVVCLAIPNNQTDPKDHIILDRIRLFIMSYFMIWAFIFNTSSYCGYLVLQREKRFKYLSNVSGMRRLPYWAANYAFDLVIFFIPLTFFFIIVYAIGEEGTFITRFAGYLVTILLMFGFSFIGYSYLFSFIFQKSTTAYRFFPFLNLIFFYFLPLIPSIVSPDGFFAQILMPLISPFVALTIFFNTKEVVGPDFGLTEDYNSIEMAYAALAIQAIAYIVAVLYLQNMRFSLKNKHVVPQQDDRHENQVYQNPRHEGSALAAPIKVDHLTKIYGNGNVAIRNNSFWVSEGQIFGLLGPNGAGKSTSFNIVTAAVPKTNGSVQLFGQEVNKGIMTIFEQVGVCPQYNPIYDTLTVREHLQYFAMVKGIPSDMLESTIAFYGNLLSLNQYMNVKAKVLSGGNKRKMCVAMAMIGNPKVAFFDEPSAGVDPISRRYLWKSLTVSTNSRKTSMILTTHSMNEAQTLCSRIGILIKGQFVCLDTPKGLKEQYGKGYRVNVRSPPDGQQEIIEIVKNQFGEVEVQRLDLDPLQWSSLSKAIVSVYPKPLACLKMSQKLNERQRATKLSRLPQRKSSFTCPDCNLMYSNKNTKNLGNYCAGSGAQLAANQPFDHRSYEQLHSIHISPLIRSSTIIVAVQVQPLLLIPLNPHSLLHTRRLLLRCSPLLLHQRATCQQAPSFAEVFTLELSSA